MAQAVGIAIPAVDLERIAASLEALEKVTGPMFDTLTPEMEPATLFRLEEEAR